jgi:hypothetical protein
MTDNSLFLQWLRNQEEFDEKFEAIKRWKNGVVANVNKDLKFAPHAPTQKTVVSVTILGMEVVMEFDPRFVNDKFAINVLEGSRILQTQLDYTIHDVRALYGSMDRIILAAASFCSELGCGSSMIREMNRMGVDIT